jgi:hypothetical protein
MILFVLVVGTVGMFLYTAQTPKASVHEIPALITNETENLQVVSSKIEAGKLLLVIKNTSDQPIIGYHFDWKAKEGLTADLTNANELAPGSRLNFIIPLDRLERDATTGLYKLNISMAIFENGDAEGNWTQAQSYRERAEGAALAASAIQAKIPRFDSLSRSTIETLASDLRTLMPPQKLGKWRTVGYEGAVIRAQVQAELMLREQQSPDKIEKTIIDLRKSMERQATLSRNILEGRKSQ